QIFHQLKLEVLPLTDKEQRSIRIFHITGGFHATLTSSKVYKELFWYMYFKFEETFCELYGIDKIFHTTQYYMDNNRLQHQEYKEFIGSWNFKTPEWPNANLEELFGNITTKYHDIYIVCNVVRYSLINNVQKRLLRICHFKSNGRLRY